MNHKQFDTKRNKPRWPNTWAPAPTSGVTQWAWRNRPSSDVRCERSKPQNSKPQQSKPDLPSVRVPVLRACTAPGPLGRALGRGEEIKAGEHRAPLGHSQLSQSARCWDSTSQLRSLMPPANMRSWWVAASCHCSWHGVLRASSLNAHPDELCAKCALQDLPGAAQCTILPLSPQQGWSLEVPKRWCYSVAYILQVRSFPAKKRGKGIHFKIVSLPFGGKSQR